MSKSPEEPEINIGQALRACIDFADEVAAFAGRIAMFTPLVEMNHGGSPSSVDLSNIQACLEMQQAAEDLHACSYAMALKLRVALGPMERRFACRKCRETYLGKEVIAWGTLRMLANLSVGNNGPEDDKIDFCVACKPEAFEEEEEKCSGSP